MAIIIQFTGLSGAGKTTIAVEAKKALAGLGYKVRIVDGDVYRQSLCKDLGFSRADRIENISRLGRLAYNLSPDYDVVIIAAINPFNEARQKLELLYDARLVFIDCKLSVLKKRDTKGLYKRANLPEKNRNKIHNLTGVNDVFEIPLNAELILNTTDESVEASIEIFKNYVKMIINEQKVVNEI